MIETTSTEKTVIEPDYWDSEMAKCGMLHVSATADCIRILIPDSQIDMIPLMLGGERITLSRGSCSAGEDSVFEIVFDDHSDSPLSLLVGSEQGDTLPEPESACDIVVYVRGEEILQKRCCWVRPGSK